MIAIALSCNPRVLIADEATTALDVMIQAQIIDLVKRLTRDLGTAVIWISHDLGVVAGICDTVAVMYAGRVVESGSVRDLFHRPSHGYTLGLLGSTPRLDDDEERRLQPIDGMPPNLIESTPLCPFLPRCAHAIGTCHEKAPAWRNVTDGHGGRCWAVLSVVRNLCDQVAVMYLGRIAELASRRQLYDGAVPPYTKALMSAVPIPDPDVEATRERIILYGDLPSPSNPPSGCRFRTRCPIAIDRCGEAAPDLREVMKGQWAACIRV